MSVKKNQNPSQDQLKLIINLYSQGEFQQSLFEANKMLKIYPQSKDLYNICGASNAGLNNLDAAINNYKKAIALKPNYAEAYNNIGLSYYAIGKNDLAINNLKDAIKIKSNNPEAYNNIGLAFFSKGYLLDSIDCYKKAVDYLQNAII